jgi:hypothetical protein
MSVLASIATLFPQPSLLASENTDLHEKTQFSLAFTSTVAISLRSYDFREGCG